VGPVINSVMDLYRETIRLAGPVSTLLEWDDEIPAFDVLATEVSRISRVREEGLRADCPVLARNVVERGEAQPTRPTQSTTLTAENTQAWHQGGPHESLGMWTEAPGQDPLQAELS
jgi:hypothetical protein